MDLSSAHDSFTGDVNLIKWAQLAFPHNLHQVLDPELLGLVDYQPNTGPNSIPQVKLDCLISTIIEIGLLALVILLMGVLA
ncbi:hypothetical protein FRX31_003374 [Thalictrum thalictroides]|uniref:Uncharacterized protein n=1 Tax=Thalictrum thalictroides TaxID=46969 RepID=A0A7J6XBM2_THATH|nr:hypothetical protein FRX31_003374 [Thalictrum thalictroides]